MKIEKVSSNARSKYYSIVFFSGSITPDAFSDEQYSVMLSAAFFGGDSLISLYSKLTGHLVSPTIMMTNTRMKENPNDPT